MLEHIPITKTINPPSQIIMEVCMNKIINKDNHGKNKVYIVIVNNIKQLMIEFCYNKNYKKYKPKIIR